MPVSAQTPAGAGSSSAFPSFIVRSGGLVADFGSNIRLDRDNGTGTDVNFEDDLGFTKTRAVWFIDGQWRMTDRHRLYTSFVEINRDATKSNLSRPITIGDTTFQVGSTIQAFIDNSYFALDYGFALVKNQKADVVATIGISTVKVHTGFGLQLQTSTGGSISRSLSNDAEDRVIFPVPGVQFAFKAGRHVDITGYTRFIKATLEGITESSWDGRVGAELPLGHHLGFGAAYYWNRVSEEGSRDTFKGKLNYNFGGPQIYGLAHF
jgi:hypothetical protein